MKWRMDMRHLLIFSRWITLCQMYNRRIQVPFPVLDFMQIFPKPLTIFKADAVKNVKKVRRIKHWMEKSFLLQPQKSVLNFKTKRKKKMHWWLFTSHTKSVCKEICILLQLCTLSILPLFQNYKGQCAFFVLIEL